MKHAIAALLLCTGAPLLADPGLPPDPLARQVIEAHPSVQAAMARIGSARAEERVLKAGPHEFIVSGSYVRRSAEREGDYDEYDATLMRAIRLPGKAALDRKAGAFGVVAAENLAEDARHQAALLLSDLWWEWMGASAEAAVDRQGIANYEAALAAMRRRVALRDAAQIDADQLAAALGDARLAAAQPQGRADYARVRLKAQFPALDVPSDAPEAPLPALPDTGLTEMRDQVVARSHEIGAADAQAARLAALAARANRDRLADPSIGLRLFSERNGAERGAGVLFSMPLGNGARRGAAERAEAEALSAAADLALTKGNVQEMATGDVVRAEAAYAAWLRAREAVGAQVAALEKLRRGQQLGAIDLADVLLGERLTHAAFRTEALARTEAHRAINRLRIDSHNLWISD